MIKLILLGLIAGAFFSATFILNELMSAGGGHWFWSASLRYLFMFVLLTAIIMVQQGKNGLNHILKLATLFKQNWLFLSLTGSIGFGLFYAGICYAADHAAGWVVASTFMFTVVASLFVLKAFGQKFSKQVVIFALMIFAGVVMVNISESASHGTAHADHSMVHTLLFGALPALIAAFSYPIGNQLIWQAAHNAKHQKKNHSKNLTFNTKSAHAKQGIQRLIPTINTNLFDDAFNKVWLMTVGSFPFWLVLGVILQPSLPSASQTFNTFLVALLSGVVATSVFLYARDHATTPQEVAGVDATQASEVIFALLGGMLFLGTALPSTIGLVGIGLIMLGLVLFARYG